MFTATEDLMLPATVTGSWPRPKWYNQNMWGRPLDTAMMDPWFREQFTDAHAICVSDQERVGLDILTTGDYHLDEDVAGRSWHHYPLQRWKGFEHDLLVEGSSNIVVGPNLFDRNPDYSPADSANGVVFIDSSDSTVTGLHSNGSLAKEAALLLRRSRRINITGATILNFAGAGVWFDETVDSRLSNSIIDSGGEDEVSVRVTGGRDNAVTANSLAGQVSYGLDTDAAPGY